MVDIIFKFIAFIGIAYVLIFFFFRYNKLKKTEEGLEFIEAGKKNLPSNIILGLISGFTFGSQIGAHPYNAIGFKATKCVEEHVIPGTMNVGLSIPAFAAILLYHPEQNADLVTMFTVVIPATLGALIGSAFVVKLNLKGVRFTIALGSIILSIFAFLSFFLIAKDPNPDTAIALSGVKLVLIALFSLILGMLMNVGTGFTIPFILISSLMGLNTTAAFSIAIVAVAFMTSFGNGRVFILKDKIDFYPCLCQFVFGTIGVSIALTLFAKARPFLILTVVAIVAALVAAALYLKDLLTPSKNKKDSI